MEIDLNRGVTIRISPENVRVHMYKDEPGVFYDIFGKEVPLKVAEAAGFDVTAALRQKEKNRLIKEAREKIERDFREQERVITDRIENAISDDAPYKPRDLGYGWYKVIGPDGEPVDNVEMKMEDVLARCRQLNEGRRTPGEGQHGHQKGRPPSAPKETSNGKTADHEQEAPEQPIFI